jgi:hypothetical protein
MPRRRTYHHPTRTSCRASPVTVRSLSSPRGGWSSADGVDLVLAGYTPEHVEKVTGWAASVLAARVNPRERDSKPSFLEAGPPAERAQVVVGASGRVSAANGGTSQPLISRTAQS